jgi:hypothetical protein
MRDEYVLQCPLLQGLDTMRRAELLGLLKDSNLRERVERCIVDRSHSVGEQREPVTCGAASTPRQNFEGGVHHVTSNPHLWRRGAKE